MPQSKNTKVDKDFLEVKSPSFRYLEVLDFMNSAVYTKRKAVPKSFSVPQKLLVSVFRKTPTESEEEFYSAEKALLLNQIDSCRAILRGYLMSGESITHISNYINEDPLTIEIYYNLFFDTSVFFNLLVKVAYIRNLPSRTDADKFEKQVLSWGHYIGAKYISWKIGAKDDSSILPSQAIRKVLDDSIWRSSEHALASITSQKAKESKAWVPQVLKSAELLNTIETTAGMENALADLKIKLSGDDEVKSNRDTEMEIKG